MSLSGAITSINLLSDSDDDNSSPSEGIQGSVSDTTVKSRNIAVKKGAPVMQQQIQQVQKPQQHQQQQYVANMQHPEPKLSRMKGLLEGSKFLADFNPENSRREKNKRYNLVKPAKQQKARGTQSMYDEQGKLRYDKLDICDCFDGDCAGCHFSCDLCGSQKCGVRCRVNRRWAFEVIEHDGKDQVVTNPLLNTVNIRN